MFDESDQPRYEKDPFNNSTNDFDIIPLNQFSKKDLKVLNEDNNNSAHVYAKKMRAQNDRVQTSLLYQMFDESVRTNQLPNTIKHETHQRLTLTPEQRIAREYGIQPTSLNNHSETGFGLLGGGLVNLLNFQFPARQESPLSNPFIAFGALIITMTAFSAHSQQHYASSASPKTNLSEFQGSGIFSMHCTFFIVQNANHPMQAFSQKSSMHHQDTTLNPRTLSRRLTA